MPSLIQGSPWKMHGMKQNKAVATQGDPKLRASAHWQLFPWSWGTQFLPGRIRRIQRKEEFSAEEQEDDEI